MIGKTKIELKGLKDLEQKLKQLTERMIKKAMKRAVLMGAEIIRADASRRVPRRTGRLQKGIIAKVTSQKKDEIVVGIGPTKDAYYGRFVELGHKIYSGRRRKRTTRIVATVPAHPFLRPAIDENEEKIIAVIASEFQREIREALG